MMDGHCTFLCIYTRTQHIGRAKQYSYLPRVHTFYKIFPCFVSFSFLYKTDFIGWNTVVFVQFAFNLGVNAPLVWFVRPQIGENKLSAFILIVLSVVMSYVPCVIGGYKHFGFLFFW